MNNIKRVEPNKRFSECVVCNNVAYISGQVDLERHRTVSAQTEAVLKIIDRLLEEVGTEKKNILAARIILANIGSAYEMNSVWEKWIDPQNPPARSVSSGYMADPSWLVQISMTVLIPN